MSVTNYTVVSAAAGDLSKLNALVADAIGDGYQPLGAPFFDGERVCQAMTLEDGAQTEYATDGALAIQSGTLLLTKGTAGAYTLAAPTAAQAGTRLRIISQTAAAHVITATNLLDDGVTGGAKDTATFAAFAGASIELEAVNLKWAVVSKNVVTVAAV